MGEKVTLVIEVDLSCYRCRKKIEAYFCRIRCKYCIEEIIYIEEKNIVRVIGIFCAEELKKKLYCKFRKIIINIRVECKEIIELTNRINVCIEEHVEINKKIEILRKECVEICKKVCGEICKGACEAACKKICEEKRKKTCDETCKKTCDETCKKKCCNDGCGEKVSCKTECRLNCKCKFSCRCIAICTCVCTCIQYKAVCKLSCKCKFNCRCISICTCVCTCFQYTEMQMTTVCCASPCPCFVPSYNNFRCCSCGVISQPPCFSGGQGFWNPPQWGFQPNCTPGRAPKCPPNYPYNCPPNFIIESSSQPYCTIM